jgi:hypothetical protein
MPIESVVTMNRMKQITVSLCRMVAAPRAPKAA